MTGLKYVNLYVAQKSMAAVEEKLNYQVSKYEASWQCLDNPPGHSQNTEGKTTKP